MDLAIVKPDRTIDVKGMSFQMPLLKTKKAVESIASGQILEVLGTDPGCKNDLPNWCARSGHEFLGDKEDAGVFCFYIKKG